MSLYITARISRDTLTPRVAELLDKLSPAQMAAAARRPLEILMRTHLEANGSNKKGWPTTGFWRQASDATRATAQPDGVLIEVKKQGVRQRLYGGPILPKTRRALTIPISPEAHGKRASDFPGSFILKTKKGAYIVQRGEKMGARGSLQPIYGKKAQGLGRKWQSINPQTGEVTTRRRAVAALEFLFKLSKGVNQKPDPSVIPTSEQLRRETVRAILANVQRRAR
jgi:hypothetical protein